LKVGLEGHSFRRSGWAELPDHSITLALAAVVGAGTALAVIGFRYLIATLQTLFFDTLYLDMLGWGGQVLPPILGGALVGLLLWLSSGKHRQNDPGTLLQLEPLPGLAGVIEAVALTGGRMPYKPAAPAAFAAAISIGSGASLGPEDPSLHVGASLGSALAQRLRVAEEDVRLLVAAGAAAGLATTFNAPIAGVFFALEVILFDYAPGSFGLVVLASVLASVVTQAVLGAHPAFVIPSYRLGSATELPFFVVLGLLAAGCAILFTRSIELAEERGSTLPVPAPLRPVLGGLILGLLALVFTPQIFGAGYNTIEMLLLGEYFPIFSLALLLVLKVLATAVSLGTGFVGGVFAPSLFVGAMLGGLYGKLLELALPGVVSAPAVYAIVGMAAMLAATIRAPLTAPLILFEMTRDYRLILPLLAAVGVAVLLAERLLPYGIYQAPLRRRGINLVRGRDIDVMQGVTVEEAMSRNVVSLPATLPLAEARQALQQAHQPAGVVVDPKGVLLGIASLADIDLALTTGAVPVRATGEGDAAAAGAAVAPSPSGEAPSPPPPATVMAVRIPDPATATPGISMWEALRLMSSHNLPWLPVVAPHAPRQVVGMISREDIGRAYELAVIRKTALQHRAEAIRLGSLTGVEVLEIKVPRTSPAIGKRLVDLGLPPVCVIASVRRGRQVLIPHGATQLQSGDVLVAVCDRTAVDTLRASVAPKQH